MSAIAIANDYTPVRRQGQGRKGVWTGLLQAEHPHLVAITAPQFAIFNSRGQITAASDAEIGREAIRYVSANDHLWQKGEDLIFVRKHNAYVNTGLNNALDREFGLGGTAIGFIGVSSNTTAVTATTVFLNGASGGTAANTIIKAISPAASRSSQTTTGGATFVNADFTSGVFIMNKLGFLNTSTDAGTGLIDVIGGTGGASPYNRTFSLDLTAAGSFSFTPQIAVTASAI